MEETCFDLLGGKVVHTDNRVGINCDNPRSMYLFFTKVQRVLYKNHGHIPCGLQDDLRELEQDAKLDYYGWCLGKMVRPNFPEPPKPERR